MLLAAVKGSQGNPRMSKYVLQKAILQFYSECGLYPAGIVSELASVQEWALKSARAIQRLASVIVLNIVASLNPQKKYNLGSAMVFQCKMFGNVGYIQ